MKSTDTIIIKNDIHLQNEIGKLDKQFKYLLIFIDNYLVIKKIDILTTEIDQSIENILS